MRPEVSEEDIAKIVSQWTGIPIFRLEEKESEKLLKIEEDLHKRVVGQDEAISAIAHAVRRSRAGIKDPKRPIGSFIFMGPTGVGKTELARALAEFLFDDEQAMVRIDMSEYMEKHSVARLIGAPPGYVGYEEGGFLTTNRDDYAEMARTLRTYGIIGEQRPRAEKRIGKYLAPDPRISDHADDSWDYDWGRIDGWGIHARMNEVQAAVGLNQLKKLDEMNGMRAKVAEWYGEVA
jgi:hypothetical protein